MTSSSSTFKELRNDFLGFLAGRLGLRLAFRFRYLVVAAIVLALWSQVAGPFMLRVATDMVLLAVLASSINVMAGFTGYPDFGNLLFFGVGGYVAAVLFTSIGTSIPVALVLATIVPAALAAVLAFPVLRLRGHYFAIGTLVTMEAAAALVAILPGMGGGSGLLLPGTMSGVNAPPGWAIFCTLLALLLGLIFFTHRLASSRLGLGALAIRFDEDAARAMGVRTLAIKTRVWMVSAAVTGLTGAIFVLWLGFVQPPVVFNVQLALQAFIALLIGGRASLLGPTVGAVIVIGLQIFVFTNFVGWAPGVLGMLMVSVAVLLPRGLFPRHGVRMAGAEER